MNILMTVLRKVSRRHPESVSEAIHEAIEEERERQVHDTVTRACRANQKAKVVMRLIKAELPPEHRR